MAMLANNAVTWMLVANIMNWTRPYPKPAVLAQFVRCDRPGGGGRLGMGFAAGNSKVTMFW